MPAGNLRPTMGTNSAASLQQFIRSNQLRHANGLVLFDAAVIYYHQELSHTIGSQIQIITLPEQMVLYIFEFMKDIYKQTEMFSTAAYNFHCSGASCGTLKIADQMDTPLSFRVAILPL